MISVVEVSIDHRLSGCFANDHRALRANGKALASILIYELELGMCPHADLPIFAAGAWH
jgi:hypothetical protein